MKTISILRIGGVVALAIFLLTYPFFASPFFVIQIGIQSLFLGLIALSLIFLAGYSGMVSLAQMGLYGAAGYTLGFLTVTIGLSWYIGVGAALIASVLLSAIFAFISVRTQGIYFLMITLAEAMLVFYFAEQNDYFTNGHTGINGIQPPTVGSLVLSDPTTFYFVTLMIAVLVYLGLRYLIRTPFGLALQGIRDNAQRMKSLGFNVSAHRIAAFMLAGLIAGIGGVLGTWYNGAISPGSIDLTRTIDILIIAVLGSLTYFEGAFVGAVFFTLITNFASSFTDRFNTVIGLAFLLVALFFPGGLIGLSKTTAQLVMRTLPWPGYRRATPTASTRLLQASMHSSSSQLKDKQPMIVSVKPEEEENQQ